jgi:hypothetical protein
MEPLLSRKYTLELTKMATNILCFYESKPDFPVKTLFDKDIRRKNLLSLYKNLPQIWPVPSFTIV